MLEDDAAPSEHPGPGAPAGEAETPPPAGVCAICLSPLLPHEDTQRCPDPQCDTLYHAECLEENRGCAIYGCSQVPEHEAHRAIEIAPSYWGQDHKSCPRCGEQIRAAAVRCRHCSTVLPTAQPLSPEEFDEHQRRRQRRPLLRRAIVALAVFSLLPPSAPLAALVGFLWYRSRRQEIAAMPSLYDGLCRISLIVAAGQTVLIAAVLVMVTIVTNV